MLRRTRIFSVISCFFEAAVVLLCLIALPVNDSQASAIESESYHFGFLHPDGVDIIGYSREKQISDSIYRFYTFGFPALAAIGINYYNNYTDHGINANIGVGIGSVAYASLNYRWVLSHNGRIQLGAGYTTGIAYNGWYPVLSYESHFGP